VVPARTHVKLLIGFAAPGPIRHPVGLFPAARPRFFIHCGAPRAHVQLL